MLRKVRVVTAILCFSLLTLLFLDFTGTLHSWFGWIAKIQFLPALLALNVGVVVFLLLLTLLFGRVYCSVICPLGVFQDVASWIAGKRKKRNFSYSRPVSWLRYGMLGLFVVAFVLGISAFVSLLDPYGAYGRIANNLFAPVYLWGNNLLAYLAEQAESYAFYPVDVWIKSSITFAVALITAVVIVVLAWRNGRTYCNTICPVGTILGFVSRFSLFRIAIDAEKCNQCSLCSRNCKASCIDFKELKVDNSRCVACMNCIGVCKQDAINYKMRYGKASSESVKVDNQLSFSKPNTEARRSFLSAVTIAVTTSVVKA